MTGTKTMERKHSSVARHDNAKEAPPPDLFPAKYKRNGSASGRKMSNQSWFNHFLVGLMPLVPKPVVKQFAKRYVAGETVDEMLATVQELNWGGISATIDVLGEFIHDTRPALETANLYKIILDHIEQHHLDANISVKLTALGLLLDQNLCLSLMQELVGYAAEKNIFVRIDMEDSDCTQITLDLYQELRQQFSNVGIVLQAYLRRTHDDALNLIRSGHGHFRLCKGIYVEPRWLAYTDPELINQNYLAVLETMIQNGAYIGIATHDERIVWGALQLIRKYNLSPQQYEFQMLLGVDHELRDMLVAAGHHLRVYVPFGKQWHAYSMRRLKENPQIAGYILQNLFSR